jgi:hypothetical protein
MDRAVKSVSNPFQIGHGKELAGDPEKGKIIEQASSLRMPYDGKSVTAQKPLTTRSDTAKTKRIAAK